MSEQLSGSDADVNCPELQSVADAQTLYEETFVTDDSDVYGLDGDDPPNDLACDGDGTDVNTEELVSCANLQLLEHADALFAAGGDDDPYNLDPNQNDEPCDGSVAAPQYVSTFHPLPLSQAPDATGCDVQVRAGRAYVNTDCADGTVEAGFTEFEGFASFAERAQNGFGTFDTATSTAPVIVVQQSLPTNS